MPRYDLLRTFEILPENATILIWGAGSCGRLFKDRLSYVRKDIKVAGFVDSFKEGLIDGLKVTNACFLPRVMKKEKADLVVIASMYLASIEDHLKKLNIDRYVAIENSGLLKQMYSAQDMERYGEKIAHVQNLFNNEQERDLYRLLIEHRELNSRIIYRYHKYVIPVERQYLDFIVKEHIKTIIEGGVFDGREIYKFTEFIAKDITVYGFEPFYDGYSNNSFFQLLKKFPNIHVFPLGLWKNSGSILFEENCFCSRILKEDEMRNSSSFPIRTIQTVSIDDWVKEKAIPKVDFIKLDVEGAELEVLQGAVETIKKHRPQLAVSIYHTKEHMFEIPLFLESILDNYSFHLAHYDKEIIETVFFAIPKELEQWSLNRDGSQGGYQ